MSTEIIKLRTPLDMLGKDMDVPDFGGFTPEQLRPPARRTVRPDVSGVMTAQSLRETAIQRALHASYGNAPLPPIQSPNAENFQHFPFTKEDWDRYGNMESEASRIAYMLATYGEIRGFPASFNPVVAEVLKSDNVLQTWGNQIPLLDKTGDAVYGNMARHMDKSKRPDDANYDNGVQKAYITEPFFYPVSASGVEQESQLWEAGLAQIATELRAGNDQYLPGFLHLYSLIKDPVTPLRATLADQTRIFSALYEASQKELWGSIGSLEGEKRLVAQLALESSFQALPAARNIAHVVYGGHQELPYIYVDLAKMPRGELTDPDRVVNKILIELIADSKKHERAVVTPIAVSYYQGPKQRQPDLFVIDGNNRATAMMLMKFTEFVKFQKAELKDYKRGLRQFVALHDLDIKWERDLSSALNILTPENIDMLLENQEIVQEFAYSQAPALLVQEPNYHTVSVFLSEEKNEVVVKQPANQVAYQEEDAACAAKQQSHGRSPFNLILVPVLLQHGYRSGRRNGINEHQRVSLLV